MREITVRVTGRDEVIRLRTTLKDVESALESIGAVIAAQARKAFEDQRLGTVAWQERAPREPEPFLNVIPVLRKAAEGRTPTADDFQRRPALGGVNGQLAGSIAFAVSRAAVEIGTTLENAGLMQFGGKSTIPITDTTRATIARWLGVDGTRAPREKLRIGTRREEYEQDVVESVDADDDEFGFGARMGKRKAVRSSAVYAPGRTSQYARKLAFVLKPDRDSITRGAYARPFIGWTDETMTDVMGELAEWLGGEVTT